MLRNLSRTFLVAGAAWLTAASALSAQTGTPQTGTALRGDVDGDGQVTVTDARIVSDYLVGRQVPAGADVARRGDVNGDGRVTSVDAAIIRASAAGRDVSRFKVGAPLGEVPANALAELTCDADVQARTVRCASAQPSTGARGIIIGDQGVNVKLTSSNVQVAGGNFTFDVTVQNLLPQKLGTTDGTTPDADGVRVFFYQKPTPNGAGDTGEITVVGAGTDAFTEANQLYYTYTAPLDSGAVTAPVNWHFQIPGTVSHFQFKVFVAAEVQFPDGWVAVAPPALRASGPYYQSGGATAPVDTVSRDPEAPNYLAAVKLRGVARTRLGRMPTQSSVADTSVSWGTSASGVATVTPIGVDSVNVAFVGDGDVTITGTNDSDEGGYAHNRSGQKQYVVRSADTATSTISAIPGVQTVGDSSQIVVQLKNSSGVNLTQSGGTVALATTGGTLSTVTNNHDGTYSAWLKSNVAGSFAVSGTLNNHTIVDTAVVTFGPRAADHFVVEAAGGGPIPAQVVNTPFNVQITAKDQFGNTATGFTGSATITSTPANHVSAGGTTAAFTAGVLASHAVTIDSVGSGWTLTATSGSVVGTSNAFQVEQAPGAVNDGPASPTSAPGQPYHGFFNQTFNLAAPGIMSNDTRGFPLATVVSFGGGSVTGTHTAGTAVDLGSGGSLQVDADGKVTFTPPTGFTGVFTFNYQIGNVRGTSNATVTIAIGERPAVVNDTYAPNVLGNVPINTATSTNFKVTTNDQGDAKVLAKTGETNGTVTLNADGTFTFTPAVGYTGPASFTYTVTNGFGTTAAATVSLNVSGIAWFVNTTADAGNDGRYGSAFDNLSTAFAAATKPQANQSIFLYSGSYTGGVTLLNGQTLVGQGATGTFSSAMGVTWPADAGPEPTVGGTRPTVASGITLGSGNTLRGFDFGNAAGAALSGTNFGTLTVSDLGINNATGQALSLNTGTLAGSFSSVQSTGGTNNVSLTGVSSTGSTLGTAGDALTGASSDGVVISGGSGTFTVPGDITNTTVASVAVNVNGKTGGTVTFSGNLNPAGAARGISVTGNNSGTNTIVFSGTAKNLNTPVGVGVNLSNNTGATIQFTNGGLAVTSGTGSGFIASGGGTVEVTGSGNTVSTTAAARAVDLNGITIGAGGIGFASITGSGTTSSAFRATSVNNSGGGAFTAGSLTVTSTTGASSHGIELTSNSAPFTFTTVSVNNTGGQGISLTGNTAAVAVNGGTVGNTTSTTGDALFVSGGNAGVTVAASLTKSTAGRIANIGSRTGGTTTVSGNLSCTGSCTGINASSNTGGTIDFTAGTKTLTTGASAAVTLASNTGATVNFTNGGLAITTTSGAGYNATGGGTVTVQGSNNTIASTGGVPLNVANTTIGAGGLTFRRIDANGGSSGIILNNTGSTAGLTVTSDGSTANSGGTIQNTTGVGISLASTLSPSFSRMLIQNTSSHGISGSLVTNFSFTNGTITGSGTSEVAGRQESNISFYQNSGTGTEKNVTGTVTITGNTLNYALHHGINITQYDGTITSLNISNNSFTSATASSGTTNGTTTSHGTAININPIGSGSTIANVSSATISNNTISGFPGNAGILFVAGNTNVGGPVGSYGSAADSITIQSNKIAGFSSGNLMNTNAIKVALGARGTGFFRVLDNGTAANPIGNTAGHVIDVSALGQAALGIRITNNRIVANNTVGSNGIGMGSDSAQSFATTAVLNAIVNSNNISATNGSGILIVASHAATTNAKILNNTIGTPGSGTYGLQLRNSGGLTNTATACYQISGNTVSGGGSGTVFPGIGLRRQSGSPTEGPNVFGIVGLSPSPAGTPTVENYVNGLNTSSSGTFGTGGTALASSSSGFTSCTLSF